MGVRVGVRNDTLRTKVSMYIALMYNPILSHKGSKSIKILPLSKNTKIKNLLDFLKFFSFFSLSKT